MDWQRILEVLSIAAIPALFAITLHEVAHGWAARWFGDRTAEAQGRLSLNPLKHVDPIGTVLVPGALLLMGASFLFGWAKPVPVNPRFLRRPKRDMAFVAAAGPGVNLAQALVWTAVLGVAMSGALGTGTPAIWALEMARIGILFNVLLAVFNMLPIPPLDGGRVLASLLPPGPAQLLERIEPFGLFIVLGLLFTGVLWTVVDPVQSRIVDALTSLVR